MLCNHCRLEKLCPIKTRMMKVRDGGRWPQGGWVHDQGGGVSCLTYRTKPIKELPVTTLRIIHSAPEHMLPKVCGGCAARKGTEASVARHTRVDFRRAVEANGRFICHETGELCGGLCRALRSRRKEQLTEGPVA